MTALPPDLIEKEYAVTIKVRNNYLLKRMRAAGYETAAELSRAVGMSQSTIGSLLNLRISGLRKDEKWRGEVIRISDHLRCLPEDIIPPLHRRSALTVNTSEIEASSDEIARIIHDDRSEIATPELEMIRKEASEIINSALEKLSPRVERIIRMRFGLDGQEPKTYEEIAQKMGYVSRERIRQIEAQAFRYLSFKDQKKDGKPLRRLIHDSEIWK